MIALEHTDDLSAVAALMRHPAVWPWVSNDNTPPDWKPEASPLRVHLLVLRDDRPVGVLELDGQGIPRREGWAELHVAFLPGARGKAALEALRALWKMAVEMGLRVIYGLVAADNRPAARLAVAAGMRRAGTVPAAFLRGGVLHDLWVFTREVS